MADNNTESVDELSKKYGQVAVHGWLSLAFWISFGLLLESLMAYKSPAYLEDPQRRELFRLAHAHGSVLGMVLIIAAIWARGIGARLSRLAVVALRLGAVVMPLGFLAAGLWHPDSEPGLAIWLVPAGALPLIFSLTSIALSSRTK
jgi:hypothetical protein